MLPGAGEPVVELMKDMLNYLNRTESWDELASSSMNFYQSVDLLLDLPNSIINELVNLLDNSLMTEAALIANVDMKS